MQKYHGEAHDGGYMSLPFHESMMAGDGGDGCLTLSQVRKTMDKVTVKAAHGQTRLSDD